MAFESTRKTRLPFFGELLASMLVVLLLLVREVSPVAAACPLLSEVHVDPSANGQAADCCGDSGTPCGLIEQALTILPSTGGTILLSPGTHSVSPQGLQLGGRPLTIAAAAADASASASPSPLTLINCTSDSSRSSSPCLNATCVPPSAGAAAAGGEGAAGVGSMCGEQQAKLVLRGVVVANGMADTRSGGTTSSRGTGSGGGTSIGGTGSGGCLLVQGQAVEVVNSSFVNCMAADCGGAIFAASSNNVTITGSHFEACKALGGTPAAAVGVGGGAAAAAAGPGTVGKGGGAIALYNVAHVAVSDSSFHKCSSLATNGGGLDIISSNAALTAVRFSGCHAQGLGGAVSSALSNVTVTDCRFRDTHAMRGGCFADNSSPFVSISSSSFLRCKADIMQEGDIYSSVNGGGVALNATVSVTIFNCTFSRCLASMDGGGLDALDPGNLTIISSVFSHGSTYNPTGGGGGAVSTRGGSVTIRGTLMEKNWANSSLASFGGAISILDTAIEIFNSTFKENICYGYLYGGAASQGAAINQAWTRREAVIPLLMDGCVFERNVADAATVGYFEGHATVRRSRHVGNEAQYRHGGAYYALMNSTIEDCLFAHNTAVQDGGAVVTSGLLSTVIRGSVFVNNTATSGEGGAIAVLDGTAGTVLVEGCRFEGNAALASKGGAISAATAALTVANCTFLGSHALVKGGAVAVSNPTSPPSSTTDTTAPLPLARFLNVTFAASNASLGGAALHLGMAARARLEGCRMEGGQASNGGGVMLEEFAQLEMARSECTGNSAPSGGGCISMSELAAVAITACNITGNQGGNEGGAIRATGQTRLSITGSLLSNNSAMDGGALWSEMGSKVHVSSSVISHNAATIQGGAFYCIQNARLTLLACSFQANTAARGGAILAEGGVKITVSGGPGEGTGAGAAEGGSSAGAWPVGASVFEGNSQHAVVLQGQAVGSFLGSVLFRGNAGGKTMDVRDGGAIFATDSTAVVVGGGVVFEGNTGRRGGAIFCDADSTLVVSSQVNVTALAAAAGADAAADAVVAASDAVATATATSAATAAPAAAATAAATTAAATAEVPHFTKNQAQEGGGAIFAAGNTSLQISDSIFESNRAATGTGGAILVLDYAHGQLKDCAFRSNEAGSDGSAVYLDRGGMGGGSSGEGGAGEGGGGGGGGGGTGGTGTGGMGGMGISKAAVGAVVLVSDIAGLLQVGNRAGVSQAGSSNLGANGNATAAGAGAGSGSSGDDTSTSSGGGGGVTGGLLPLNVSGLSFLRNRVIGNASTPALSTGGGVGGAGGAGGAGNGGIVMAAGGLGSAFLDATFLPAMRSTCVGCEAMDKQDTIGTLPASFQLLWSGQNDSDAAAADTIFQVKGDRANPVTNLHVTILDAAGLVAVNDFRAKASILPSPAISGLLQATSVNGRATIPPVTIVEPPESGNLSLTLSVSSSLDAFPPISRTVEIAFCPPGQFYTRPNMACAVCPVGSWCGSGRGAEFCPAGSYSFFPGATSLSDCLTCPTTSDVLKDTVAVTCESGKMQVEEGFWLDFNSITAGSPAVYACDVLDGCAGLVYSPLPAGQTSNSTQQPASQSTQSTSQSDSQSTALQQPQCKAGYSENRLCSSCAPGYYSVLKLCYECSASFQRLFPLLIVLIVLAWVAMGVLSDSFHTIAIFAIELQMLTFIGSYNLPLPPWVHTIVQYFQIALFVPDVIGPGCTVSYSFVQQWAVTMVIPVLGVLVYACLYLTHRLYGLAVTRIYGAPKNHLITSTTTLPPAPPPPATASAARAAAANGTSAANSAAAAIGGSRADDLAPLTTKREMFDKYENTLIHGVTNWLDLSYAAVTYRCFQAFYQHWYEYDYFWWHLTCYARRIILVSIAVFGVQSPQTQVSVTLPLQAIRIGLQYGASPFAAFSHDILNSLLALAEFLFTVALTGYNYIGIDTGANVLFGFSFALIFLPTLAILCYELINWYITRCNCRELNHMWQKDKAKKSMRSRKRLISLSVDDLVHPSDVARWFRPHVLSAFLHYYSPASSAYQAARRKTLSDEVESGVDGAFRTDQTGDGDAGSGPGWERFCGFGPDFEAAQNQASSGGLEHLSTAEMRRRRRLLLRLRDRFEQIRLAGPGDTKWTKHLSKSQMYGVLSQALLGAAVGEVTVARMPVSRGSEGLLEGGAGGSGAAAAAGSGGCGAGISGAGIDGGPGSWGCSVGAAGVEGGGGGYGFSGRLVGDSSRLTGASTPTNRLSTSDVGSKRLGTPEAGSRRLSTPEAGSRRLGTPESGSRAVSRRLGTPELGSARRVSVSLSGEGGEARLVEAGAAAGAVAASVPISVSASGGLDAAGGGAPGGGTPGGGTPGGGTPGGGTPGGGTPGGGTPGRGSGRFGSRSLSRRERWVQPEANRGEATGLGAVGWDADEEDEERMLLEWPPRLDHHVSWTATDAEGGELRRRGLSGSGAGEVDVLVNGDREERGEGMEGDELEEDEEREGEEEEGESEGDEEEEAEQEERGEGGGNSATGENGQHQMQQQQQQQQRQEHHQQHGQRHGQRHGQHPSEQHSGHEQQAGQQASQQGEYVEARMNMAELTLLFQRHLALLVRNEALRRPTSLRLLLRSEAIQDLLAWLTSPHCEPEDQQLLRDVVAMMRSAAVAEAGSLHWYQGFWAFFRTHSVLHRAKTCVQPCLPSKPLLEDG
ncbi:hypothetical protein CLOP_g19190 [Closterium sp. NIES-67]|nr:hypothetical protein CLOP_g19190 [Closterium sp. NIES-67]